MRSWQSIPFVLAWMLIGPMMPMRLWAADTPPADAARSASSSLEGVWYEVAVECPFCTSFVEQSLVMGQESTLVRFSDRLELGPALQSAQLVTRQPGAESVPRSARAFHLARKNQIVLIHYAEGSGARTSDLFARIWVLSPLGEGKLLYGRRYLVSAFSDEAFEAEAAGYHGREKFLPTERLLAILEDVRVYSMNEGRKVYQPSPQVRVMHDGAVGFVREGITEQDVSAAKEQAKQLHRERASRETLFRTLVQQGDQAYAAGKYDEALSLFKAASTLLPEQALVHADLGAVYQVQNKLPEAEAAYRLALELEPEDLDTLFNLGRVLEQTSRLQEALELYRKVLERRPQDHEAKERISRLSQKLGG